MTGSGYPGESAGLVPGFQHWRPIGQATMSYGYGCRSRRCSSRRPTPCSAPAGCAGPISMRKVDAPPAGERVLDESVARELVRMMQSVVSEDGTARRAARHRLPRLGQDRHRVEGVRRRIFARTATCRCSAASCRRATRGSPAVIVIDEPSGGHYYGGEVAAPVFSAVMSGALRLLAVPPDDLQRVPATTLVQAQDPW